jgi:hypothetical protein
MGGAELGNVDSQDQSQALASKIDVNVSLPEVVA